MRDRPAIQLSPEQKHVVWHLRTNGAAARTELAAQLGVRHGALTRITRELLALRVVEEAAPQSTPFGRPTVPLILSADAGYAAGVTVHPGWLELVLVDFTGAVIARANEPFDNPDPRAFIAHVDGRLRALINEHNLIRSRFLGLGIASPGATMVEDRSRRWTHDWLSGWRTIDNDHYFADYLGLPTLVEETATAAALAEYYDTGLIRSCATAIVLFLGHGVGGGAICGRDLFRGEFGNAGDIGRIFPSNAPRPSGIDLLSCLRAAGAQIDTLFDIGSCLESHGVVIAEWVKRAADQLNLAILCGTAWLDPGAVVLSGCLPQPILDALGTRLQGLGWRADRPDWLPLPTLHVSRLGSWSAAIGAALMPIHRIFALNAES
jgi:predicted NBD/HSP70 family sugar kinase